MKTIATFFQPSIDIEKCRKYWFQRHDLKTDPGALCQVGSQPPLQCMWEEPKGCKGQMLIGLTNNLPKLLALAEIEEMLLWHAAFGGRQELDGKDDNREKTSVKASFLQWLLTNPRVKKLISNNGIRVKNIKIEGDLNLDTVTIDFPVIIKESDFTGRIILTDAETRFMSFEGSTCSFIKAEQIKIKGIFG